MTRFVDRQFIQEIKSAGLTLVEFGFTGSGHLKARVRSGEGPVLTVVAPCTGSDWRGQRNRKAQLRRIARGDPRWASAAAPAMA